MSDCACCNYVTSELERFKREAERLKKELATVYSDREWYEKNWRDRGVECDRLARRIRSFEGASTRRKNEAKAARLAAKRKA